MRSKLIKARTEKGFTQEEMAALLGVTRACYSNYENGIREPSIQKIILIKRILDTNRDEIFLNDSDMNGINSVSTT